MIEYGIRYGVEEFLKEYNPAPYEKKMVGDFMKTVETERLTRKEAKGAIVLIQLAVEMFVEMEETK